MNINREPDYIRTVQPTTELAFEQNFRDAIEGIGHIRRALEETFGGLHGTHCEPDIADSGNPTDRVISIRHKDYAHLADDLMPARLWLEASPQPSDLQTSSLVMWVKRLSLSLRSACPDNKLPKAAMGYLQNNGLISIADCLRGNNEEPPA